MSLDIGRAVTYPFEDAQWRAKLLPLLILSFIPGLNVLTWGGYAISVARNLTRREKYPLATWDEWSDILVRGLLSWVAMLVYFLPAIIVGGCFLSLSLVFGERVESSSFIAMRCLAYLLSLAYLFFTNFVLNAGHLNFVRTDQFSGYLDLPARFRDLRRGGSRILTLTVLQVVLVLLIGLLIIVGGVVFLVCINIAVRTGGIAVVIVVPILLIALVALLALMTLAFLAHGYFIGGTSILIARQAMPAPESLPEMQSTS
ncbi:MAG: DUF4013 domain-containing protein [Anaerolineae bacterium]|nr:DUF4013 domain-containing protein [Anaerolineae bacterium]